MQSKQLAKFFGKLKRRKPLLVRRVAGGSMLPVLRAGGLVWATGWYLKLRPGDVVIIVHDGLEKIKRLHGVRGAQIYVLGDNAAASTDSRNFGWLPKHSVMAKVRWPTQKHLRR